MRGQNINGFKLVEVIVIVIITGILCSVATGMIFYKHYSTSPADSYEGLSNDENVNEFLQVYASILDEYYEDVNKEELVDSAINAMFNYLGDDYTEHLDEKETGELLEKLSGEYKGIGVEIYLDKEIYSVFEDSPAKKAGLEVGDKIIKINEESVTEKDNEYVANTIKNLTGKFKLTVLRNGQEVTVTVENDKLFIPSVSSKILDSNDKKVGYIQISTFSNTTYKQFKTALTKLENENIASLIIDVRSNSGGYLVSAKDIASLFLEKGKVIYSLEDKNEITEYKDKTAEKKDYKVVVLINEYSASASEVLTSALKDSYGATIVGKKSYGKGKVQQTLSLDDGSMAKYTTAKWLRPNGECVDTVGIYPDVEADITLKDDQTEIIDTQLDKALEVAAS